MELQSEEVPESSKKHILSKGIDMTPASESSAIYKGFLERTELAAANA